MRRSRSSRRCCCHNWFRRGDFSKNFDDEKVIRKNLILIRTKELFAYFSSWSWWSVAQLSWLALGSPYTGI